MNVPVKVEGPRGCGFRKPGGLYLVSGELSEPCPLLPYETSVCPTCGEGIKPARGFTWVDGAKFIPPQPHGTEEHTAVCPLAPEGQWTRDEDGRSVWETLCEAEGDAPAMDIHTADGTVTAYWVSRLGRCGLIWVGEQHYKTPGEFMREAAEMGVSRRITAVPRDFEVGVTWVLLGHRKAIERACSECGDDPGGDPECPVCNGTGFEHRPGIITAFRPTAIEYVVKGDESDDELEALVERGLTPVKVVRAEQEVLA